MLPRAGWTGRPHDPHQPTLNAAPGLIRDELHALTRHGLADDPDGAAGRLSIATKLENAVGDVEFVQENGPEIGGEKIAIFSHPHPPPPPPPLPVSPPHATPTPP